MKKPCRHRSKRQSRRDAAFRKHPARIQHRVTHCKLTAKETRDFMRVSPADGLALAAVLGSAALSRGSR